MKPVGFVYKSYYLSTKLKYLHIMAIMQCFDKIKTRTAYAMIMINYWQFDI